MNKIYTGYKNCTLYIKKVKGRFYIASDDTAFVDYYVGNESCDTYNEAFNKLQVIYKQFDLGRFDKNE